MTYKALLLYQRRRPCATTEEFEGRAAAVLRRCDDAVDKCECAARGFNFVRGVVESPDLNLEYLP